MKNIIEALNWRYATKKFDPTKKIPADQINQVLEAMRLSASSYGLQPWKFVLVNSPEKREALKAAAYGQGQITDATAVVVLAVRTDVDENYVDNFVKIVSTERNVSKDKLKGYSDMMKTTIKSLGSNEAVKAWSSRQVYVALGTGLTTAALLGIDACPMEGFDPVKADEVLDLKAKNLESRAILTLGTRSAEDASASYKKVRFSKSEVVVEIK